MNPGQDNPSSVAPDVTPEPIALGPTLLTTRTGPPWRLWLPIGATAIALVAGGVAWSILRANPSAAPAAKLGAGMGMPAASVKLVTVGADRLEEGSDLVGSLESRQAVSVRTKVDGRIEQILVKEGDRVRAGQALFVLDSASVAADVLANRASADSARASLAELQAGSRPEDIAEAAAKVERARADLDRSLAKLAELQAGNRPEEVAEAQARLSRARAVVTEVRARLVLSQTRLRRNQDLAAEGVIARDRLDGFLQEQRSTEAELARSQAELAEAQKAWERIRRGNRSETIAAGQADVASARAALSEAEQAALRIRNGPRSEEIRRAQSQVAEASARISAARVKLNDTTIVAPFAGVIGAIPAKVGDYVEKNRELTTVNDDAVLQLNLAVPIERASQLRLGLPVQILDGQARSIASGVVNFIAPNTSAQSQTLLAKASFENLGNQLRQGQAVQARLVWSVKSGVLVPVNALSRLGGQAFVFVAESAPPPGTGATAPGSPATGTPAAPPPGPGASGLIARQRPVTLGTIQGDRYQVLSGLQAGDRLIVSGVLNLRDGSPIKPIDTATEAPSPANRP